MSPRKAALYSKPGKKNDEAAEKPAANPDLIKARARKPRVSAVQPVAVKVEPGLEPVEVHLEPSDNDALPPTTPAPNLFFPPASEPSVLNTTERVDRQGNAVKGANLEGMTRPTRRIRSAVNYAEPSLNTKMRRPDKSLVDAVYMRSTSNPPPSSEKKPMRIVFVKKEAEDDTDSAWKSLNATEGNEPVSPSATKVASLALHQESKSVKPSDDHTGARAAINTLAGARAEPSKTQLNTEERAARRLSDKMQELDIADHKTTSPAERPVNATLTARQRRHSAISGATEVDQAEDMLSKDEDILHSSPAANDVDAKVAARPRVSFVSGRAGAVQAARSDRASRRRSMVV